jgi:hypothetical protein
MKTPYFIAFIALTCVLFIGVDVRATTYSPNYNLTSGGVFSQTDLTGPSCINEIEYSTLPSGGGSTNWSVQGCTGTWDISAKLTAMGKTPADTEWIEDCIECGWGDEHHYGRFYWWPDFTFHTEPAPPVATLTFTAPANGATITDLTNTLDISYSNLDYVNFPYLQIQGQSEKIGVSTPFFTQTLSTGTGTFSIPFSDFGIETNERYFFGGAQFKVPYIGGGTEDLVNLNPAVEYGLYFNITGALTPYFFTNFDEWYTENVASNGAGYATPSAWAETLVSFLTPVLEKVGEFGDKIQQFLNVSDSYSKGYSIGVVFPTFNAYIDKINVFFGGFPLASFFKWTITIMFGLFCVKGILKLLAFIPFFGGSG